MWHPVSEPDCLQMNVNQVLIVTSLITRDYSSGIKAKCRSEVLISQLLLVMCK